MMKVMLFLKIQSLFGRGMNVTKLGPTCITLYDFNMLGKKNSR